MANTTGNLTVWVHYHGAFGPIQYSYHDGDDLKGAFAAFEEATNTFDLVELRFNNDKMIAYRFLEARDFSTYKFH